MQTITTIGLDIAKSVFRVHGIDAEGKVVIRRQLKRRYVVLPEAAAIPGIGQSAIGCAWAGRYAALRHFSVSAWPDLTSLACSAQWWSGMDALR
jgi:transposase